MTHVTIPSASTAASPVHTDEPARPACAPVARFELDRYCESCGHNLRGQDVWREPALGLLVAQCPECGSFEPANHAVPLAKPLLRRLAPILLLLWMGVILAFHGFGLIAIGGMNSMLANVHDEYVRWSGMSLSQYATALTLLTSCGVVLSAAVAAFDAAVLPHWPAWARIVLAWVWPAPTAAFILYSIIHRWSSELFNASALIAVWFACFFAAGSIGALLGRRSARGLCRLFLPPTLRQSMAYLWVADGLPPPKLK